MTITFATISVAVIFLSTLAVLIAVRLLDGDINTRGLLRRKGAHPQDDGVSPERIQLLISTVVIAGMYLQQTMQLRGTMKLPEVPQSWLAAQGASQLLYLGAKLFAFRPSPSKSNE